MTLENTIQTRGGRSYKIYGTPQKLVTSADRMEFRLDGPQGQQLLFLNLSHQAALLLEQEDAYFQPENWLWITGLELIKNEAELTEFEEIEYHILSRNLPQIKSTRLINLPRNPQ